MCALRITGRGADQTTSTTIMKKRALKKSKKAKKPRAKKPAAKKSKKALKKKSHPKARKPKAQKPIGVVTHFYTNIQVAIIKFNTKVPAGAKLHYKGATTDFVDVAKSMQYDHAEIKVAPKNKQIGIKVRKRVREGDHVHIAE